MTWRLVGMTYIAVLVFAAPTHAEEGSVLESRLADCAAKQDGHCFLRVAAFDEAAAVFEALPAQLNKAVAIRAELGQLEKAYTDAVTFVRTSNDAHARDASKAEALSLGERVGTADFYERFLKDFKDHAPADAVIVAHAKLGALYMKASCPIQTFHGGCVEIWQEARNCPKRNEGPYQPKPIFRPRHGNGTTYFSTVTKPYPRDKRLLALATTHLRAALNAQDLFWAEQTAMPVPARRRALANAWSEAMVAQATLDLDRFLGMGGVPEALAFDAPTQFDTPCKAERKKKTFEYSQKTFLRFLTEKTGSYTKLLSTYREAIVRGGPESVVVATARFAQIQQVMGNALYAPNTELLHCPRDGFIDFHPYPFEEHARLSAQACLHLANTYALTNAASQYCRFLANQGLAHEGDAIHELFPDPRFMSLTHDDPDDGAFLIPILDTPPKAKPKPPKFACTKTRNESASDGILGVLEMNEGHEFAKAFTPVTPFPDTFPAELAKRFPVNAAKSDP